VRNEIVRSFVEEKMQNGLSQVKLAEKLGVDKSVVSRQLNGEQNLTLRSIAELAWALDRDIQFSFVKHRYSRVRTTEIQVSKVPTADFRKNVTVVSTSFEEA
jgi:transcriptional regulator with XRE-family HTH domain